MKKVAIFGNAGGGKSTLARQLAAKTDLPLYSLDKIKYRAGGDEIPQDEYLRLHSDLISRDAWIIDGFGCMASAWERFAVADTLIYVDLPLLRHGAWITKRMIKGLFVNPEGWPENSPILKGSLNSYRVLWLCHTKLTPAYRTLVTEAKHTKQVYHLTSPNAIRAFLNCFD
ncbi:DNA topology modulation protein [Marinobacterium lacunae]|uniref:DNA topology modulation protein n=1 Tax=Marinobacterium lacunae TaxID=1232683 RepID=A0A081G304_9GAMM|nr:adenylate kinase [Marinobacterium lacunae]KEA65159.1 DNA topology modulation protein [Marinobacterium lacunae]